MSAAKSTNDSRQISRWFSTAVEVSVHWGNTPLTMLFQCSNVTSRSTFYVRQNTMGPGRVSVHGAGYLDLITQLVS